MNSVSSTACPGERVKEKHKYGCQFKNNGHSTMILSGHYNGTWAHMCIRYEDSVLIVCSEELSTDNRIIDYINMCIRYEDSVLIVCSEELSTDNRIIDYIRF